MGVEDIGDNIRRLMKLKGFSIAKLAKEMDLGTATISNILNGKSDPKSSTLIRFSKALNVSFNELLSDVPKLKSVRFRTLKTISAREKAEKDQILIYTAQWLENYNELESLLKNKVPFKLNGLKSRESSDMAKEVRKKLKISQKESVYDIAKLIGDSGIKLLIRNFGFKQTNGLSVAESEKGPAIVINSNPALTVERQIFTVAHELGHLLLHKDSYQKDDSNNKDGNENTSYQEKEADKFAGHFLLPDEALKTEWKEAEGLHWVDAILKIKRKYKVSYLTVLVRLCQIDQKQSYPELFRHFAIDYKKRYKHDLKDHYEPDALVSKKDPEELKEYDFMEDRFEKLVRQAYEQEGISMSRAAEILNKTINDMRDLVSSWKNIRINME